LNTDDDAKATRSGNEHTVTGVSGVPMDDTARRTRRMLKILIPQNVVAQAETGARQQIFIESFEIV
jgi:hypothetical protein